MNSVQPIRDKDKIREILANLRALDDKYYIMFMVGLYSGLRISDILKLKVKDVKDRVSITLVEQKTDKAKTFAINKALIKELRWYCAGRPDEEYLILSREGFNKPVTRDMAYKVLREAGKQVGIEHIGTHTMRKTFGFQFYQQTKDIVLLQKLFNHSATSITLRYIGIHQDAINNALKDFSL